MKKVLITAVIVVLLIALAITGTAAIYTSSSTIGGANDPNDSTITAKKFFLGTGKSATSFVNTEIAPSEVVLWDFQVTNQKDSGYITGVDMNLLITLNVTTDIKNIKVCLVMIGDDGMTVDEIVDTVLNETGTVTFNPGVPAFNAKVAKTLKYGVKIFWDGSDDASDTALEGSGYVKINVSVKGQQNIAKA